MSCIACLHVIAGESPTKLQKRAGLIDDAAEDDDADDDKAVSMAADDFDDAGSLGDFIDNDDGSLNGRPGSGGRNPTRVRRPASASAQPKGVQPQEAIQPGSTPAGTVTCYHLPTALMSMSCPSTCSAENAGILVKAEHCRKNK